MRPKLRPDAKKHAFLILGLDFMLDQDKELWLLECNAGPVIRRADYQMLKSLLDLVCVYANKLSWLMVCACVSILTKVFHNVANPLFFLPGGSTRHETCVRRSSCD